jgi:hypothetical protein
MADKLALCVILVAWIAIWAVKTPARWVFRRA